jgi:CHAD domain-containing protein
MGVSEQNGARDGAGEPSDLPVTTLTGRSAAHGRRPRLPSIQTAYSPPEPIATTSKPAVSVPDEAVPRRPRPTPGRLADQARAKSPPQARPPKPARAEAASPEQAKAESARAGDTKAPIAEQPAEQRLPSLGPGPGPVLPSDSFAAAGRKAMWIQVDRMLQREEAVRDPDQSDALKRYRVATRRLRAALRVFREAYPRRETKPIRTGLSELADALGSVRDLDVRLEEVDRWARERGDGAEDAIRPLRRSLAAQRHAAAAALARKLDGRAHRRLIGELVDFVTTLEPEVAPHAGTPERATRDRAGSSVWAAYEQVRSYAAIVRWADLPTLHGLRIEAKRLRYTVEFLGNLLGPEKDLLVERLVALQDHLGALNDATLAVAAVRSFLGEHHVSLSAEERATTISYLGDRERELGRLRRGVGRAWRPVVGITFARRISRAVVSPPQG